MLLKWRSSLPIVTVFMLIFNGCIVSSEGTEIPLSLESPTLIGTSSTKTSTAILAPPQSPSPTSIPTLPAEDAHQRLSSLLAGDSNCLLPCIFYITPGKSTFHEARLILTPLSSISDRVDLDSPPGFIGLNYIEGDTRININIGFLADPNTNIISSLSFHAQGLREMSQGDAAIFGDPVYEQLLKTYSLQQILAMYGSPLNALVRTNSKPPPQTWGPFELLISYPEMGILAHYTMPMSQIGENIAGCPSKSKLDLYVQPSGIFTSTEEQLAFEAAPLKTEDIFPGFHPIEDVTMLSLIEFAGVFSQSPDECISTPAMHWPEP